MQFLVHKLKIEDATQAGKKLMTAAAVVLILAGAGSGYLLAKRKSGETVASLEKGKVIKKGKIFGSKDKVFKDSAEGVLEKGGIDGEGTHKLVREGGPSQTAYLTSSVINLDDFVGKKVRVWGETFAAERAGWLMDVGRLEVLE